MGKQDRSEKSKLLAEEQRTATLSAPESLAEPSQKRTRLWSERQRSGRLGGRLGAQHWAVQTIALYQRYLSPLKGFHCAHRRLYGGLSCSEYVKQTIANQGIKRSLPLSRERFRACRVAHEILKAHTIHHTHPAPQTHQPLERLNPLGQSLETIVLQGALQQTVMTQTGMTQTAVTEKQITRMESGSFEDGEDPDPPAETITEGEYYAAPDLNPLLPPPNPLASCLVCAAIDGCCGGPSMLGGLGCGDPLEGCSCCWDGCDLSACSCCL